MNHHGKIGKILEQMLHFTKRCGMIRVYEYEPLIKRERFLSRTGKQKKQVIV
jgi:hypothetical protein